jgi:hypothetical protein
MVVSDDARSREELAELVAAQQLLIDQLSRRLSELNGNVADSGISGWPRQEGWASEGGTASRRDPDEVVTHTPSTCTSCGEDLFGAEIVGTERRRVFEISEIHLMLTEHVLERRVCTSGHETDADAPGVALTELSYGPGVMSFAAYLARHHHLPLDQAAEILSDVLGYDFALGEVAQLVSEA